MEEIDQGFTIHVNNDYSYSFETEYKSEIIDAIKQVYWKQNGVNLPIYGVNHDLMEYNLTKQDVK